MARTDLFSNFRLGPTALANRIVMAPMTRSRAGAGLVPSELAPLYYSQRAGAGLIIAEATHAQPEGVGYIDTPGIHTDEQVAGWRRVTEAVHRAGGRIFLQLWHTGRIGHHSFQPDGGAPVAPSAIAAAGNAFTREGPKPFPVPRALEAEEIPGIVANFALGARRAVEAGFDGVELHGANGYLIDQFLRDGTNRRTDAYGGSIANRSRFLLEIVQAVTAAIGAERVGVRISPFAQYNDMNDSDPHALFRHVAQALNPFGLAYLHVIEPASAGHPMAAPAGTERLLPSLRRLFDAPIIVNGGYDKASAEATLAAGLADLVSFGAPFVSNPDLPARFATGAALTPPDASTFYGGGAKGYVDYPFMEQLKASA
ncbi:MAG TPA: alkene reductase [Alphaproteobacteria bacterium]|nr:alkene reductase [Alphaproteobacteria bacterium]